MLCKKCGDSFFAVNKLRKICNKCKYSYGYKKPSIFSRDANVRESFMEYVKKNNLNLYNKLIKTSLTKISLK